MNSSELREESRKDPDTLVREIEETRADVGETLDALQARLSPGQLLDQALGFVREHGGEFAHNLGDSVKQNPVPTLLTGVGLAWMMASQGTSGTPRYRYTYGEAYDTETSGTSGELRERLSDKFDRMKERASGARDRMSDTAHSVSDRMSSGSEQARLQAQRARENFSRMLEDQPLVLGAMGLALGAMIGSLLPPSETEDRLLGETSDRMKHRAKDVGEREMERQLDKTRSAVSEASRSDSGSATGAGGSPTREGAPPPGAAGSPSGMGARPTGAGGTTSPVGGSSTTGVPPGGTSDTGAGPSRRPSH